MKRACGLNHHRIYRSGMVGNHDQSPGMDCFWHDFIPDNPQAVESRLRAYQVVRDEIPGVMKQLRSNLRSLLGTERLREVQPKTGEVPPDDTLIAAAATLAAQIVNASMSMLTHLEKIAEKDQTP